MLYLVLAALSAAIPKSAVSGMSPTYAGIGQHALLHYVIIASDLFYCTSPVGVRIVCVAKIKRERQKKNAFLYPRAFYHYNFTTMALIASRTRANERLTSPLCPKPDNKATTRKRTRFFAVYDQNCLKILFRELC
jgi:hypothetical protein